MQSIVIGIFGVLGVLLALGISRRSAGMSSLTAALSDLRVDVEDLWERLTGLYIDHILPVIRRMGYVAIFYLLASFVITYVEFMTSPSSTWMMGTTFAGGAIAVIGSCCIWLYSMQRSRDDFSSTDHATYIAAALLVQGLVLFIGGIGANSIGTIALGVTLILMAKEVLFLVVKVYAKLAAYGVDVGEGSSNFLLKIITGVLSKKSFEEVVAPGGVNIANQERFIPMVKSIERNVNLALYPFLAVGILLHGFVWLGVIGVITFATFFAYAMLEAEGVDVTERRKRAVVAWEWVSYGLTILAVLSMLIPQLRSAIDARMELIKSWIVGLPKGTSSLKFMDLKTAVAGAVAWGVVALLAYPQKGKAKDGTEIEPAFAGPRRMLAAVFAVPFVIFLFGAVTSFSGSAAHGDMISFDGVRASSAKSPKIALDGVDVVIDWESVPNAIDYRIEKHLSGKTGQFDTVASGFAKGVTHWRGPVAPGLYRFRVVAVYVNSGTEVVESDPSPETEDFRVGPAPAPSGSASGSASVAPSSLPSQPASKPAATVATTSDQQVPCTSGTCTHSPKTLAMCKKLKISCN
jgi:hypothetical protein